MTAGIEGERPRAWQRMLSGRRLDLLDPSPADVAIEDIAHGLARVARWNGQTSGPYAFSVAQHAVIVADVAVALDAAIGREGELAALLHDAAEYVIGDLISPFKAAIGLDYRAFEHRLQAAIHARFSLPHPLPAPLAATIKQSDRIAAYYEATRLAGFGVDEAARYFGAPEIQAGPLAEALRVLAPVAAGDAQAAFLARYERLRAR